MGRTATRITRKQRNRRSCLLLHFYLFPKPKYLISLRYGTWVDEWNANGYLICRSELTAPGSYKVSYLVSGEAGRSKPNDDVTYVDASETSYQYQAHAGNRCIQNHYTILYHTILYHTILYHTIPYHTIPHHTIHTIPHHTLPYHIIPYHTIPYHTIHYHTIPYHTTPSHTILYHTTPN